MNSTHRPAVGERPAVPAVDLTRAAYAGGQRYAATWTGDNVSSWQHLKMGVQQMVNLGLSGFLHLGVREEAHDHLFLRGVGAGVGAGIRRNTWPSIEST